MPEISRAHPKHADDIAAVINAAFRVERTYRVGERTSAADVIRLMQSGLFLVAGEGNRIVGAVYVRITDKIGYFAMLAVEPSSQRSGIGRVLLEAAEDYCREHGCTVMTLTTGEFRQELLKYYAHFGYQVTGIEPAPEASAFNRAVNVVSMAKPLVPSATPSPERQK
ncbi:MAG TPA: GNAT family N-acetyltransferase [Terriglobales bacterium]|nr:GNAT family N-acetyltransferase [Terriglobales bacterium]